MRLEARLARLEQQRPEMISAAVRRWLGWPVTDAQLAADHPCRAMDVAKLSADVREWLGL